MRLRPREQPDVDRSWAAIARHSHPPVKRDTRNGLIHRAIKWTMEAQRTLMERW